MGLPLVVRARGVGDRVHEVPRAFGLPSFSLLALVAPDSVCPLTGRSVAGKLCSRTATLKESDLCRIRNMSRAFRVVCLVGRDRMCMAIVVSPLFEGLEYDILS